MAQFQNIYPIDLNIKKKGAHELLQPIGEGDANGVRVGAQVFADGAPVTLNGQCVAKVIRADGSTVPLTGTISGNIASVALDQQSCAVEGPIQVAVIWVSGTNVTTLVIAYGTIVNTISGTIIQPSAPIPDLTQLLAEIEAMRQATAAANAAAEKSVRYDITQTLDATQQARARGNISAPSAADLAALADGKAVRYDITQTLVPAQMRRGRDNLNAADALEANIAGSNFMGNDLFMRGSLDQGTVTDVQYRIVLRKIARLTFPVTVVARTGFRVYVATYYETGNYRANSGWQISYTIPKDTNFRITIARDPDDTTETATINTFTGNVIVYHGEVRYDSTQALSEASQAQARTNIGAASAADLAAEAAAREAADSDLKSALNTIETPQIVGMVKTGNSSTSSNLFQYATMIGYHKLIYSISGGKVVLTDATSSDTYLIPVDGVSTYTFTFCRSAVVVSDAELTAVSSILNNVQSVNSTGGKYIVFSFNTATYPESSYKVTKPIDKYKVPKDWDFGDVKIHTPQIDGMLPTGKIVKSRNLFPSATLIYTGKYVDRIVDGKAYFVDSTNLDTYLLPVDGSTTYSFTNCRTALLVSDLEYTAVGTVLSYVTEINTTGAAYVLFSFNRTTYPPDSYVVTHPVAQYTIPADWDLQSDHKTQYQINTGSIADGGSIALTGKTAVKFGQRIVFKGVITSFSQIKLAFYNYNNSSVINSIIVDSTNLYVYSGTTAVQTWTHGLTIAHDISLIVDYLKDNVQISLESDGTIYKNTATWGNLTSGVVSVSAVSTGTVCSSAILLMAIPEALKPIWYFGDSYISHTNQARWTYYLLDYGFDNGTLLNGYAGGTSATSVMALSALLGYGTPKFAVFATGMNDGSDTSSAPSTSWTNAKNNFLSLCENNGITPVFCTIPTVPSVNNEQKNAWVRASGYRYIDFASAVGSQYDGTWYAGMLSADNVHPTEKGAIALFTRAISDFPEFVAE